MSTLPSSMSMWLTMCLWALPFHVSSFGVIPKKGQLDKWCLIVDLSSPWGWGCCKWWNWSRWIHFALHLGWPSYSYGFAIWAWNCGANIILTLVLPFGLLSAPYIFNAVAEAVEWILVNSYKVPNLLHYLDDFITVSSPDSPQCAQNLSTSLAVCKRGAYSSTNCAGHQVGFSWVAQVACLPAIKFHVLRDLILSWLPHKWCYRHELESLIAHLHHAAQVVQPGRILLHCMIDLLCCF